MSVNKPGLAKSSQALTFTKNTQGKRTSLVSAYRDGTAANPRSTVTANLRNTTTSVGVFTSSGARVMLNGGRTSLRNVNPMFVKPDHSDLRAGLNLNRGYDIKYMKDMQNWWTAQGAHHCNSSGMSGFEKAMIAMSMINNLAKTLDDVTTDKAGKSSLAKAAANPSSTESVSNKAISNGVSTGTFATKLDGSSSFGEIKGLESQVENKKANLDSDYKKSDVKSAIDEGLAKEDVKAGLAAAGINLDTSSIALQTLDTTDMTKAIETVTKDIQEVKDFISGDLKAATATATSKSETLGQQIVGYQSSIDRYTAIMNSPTATESEKAEAKAKVEEYTKLKEEAEATKKQVDAAIKELGDIEKTCNKNIQELEAKKAEVEDVQKFEAEVKDKKYEMAQNQDKQLGKIMDKIIKLDKEISAKIAQNNKKSGDNDSKRNDKIDNLISERSALYASLGTLTSSLSSAGQTEFENSKGKKYSLQNLEKAINYAQAQPAQEQPPTQKAVTPPVINEQDIYDNLGVPRTMMDDTAFA